MDSKICEYTFHAVVEELSSIFLEWKLEEVFKFNDTSVINQLLQENVVDANHILDSGRSLLMHACLFSSQEIVELLLQHKADVNIMTTTYKHTALHITALFGSFSFSADIMKLLLRNNADPNAQDSTGLLPLNMCLDDPVLTKILVEGGTNINKVIFGRGYPIHSLVLQDNYDVLELFVRNGAKVNEIDCYHGTTPLALACDKYFLTEIGLKTVKLLIKAGANVLIKDEDGKTALDRTNDIITMHERTGNEVMLKRHNEIAGLLIHASNPNARISLQNIARQKIRQCLCYSDDDILFSERLNVLTLPTSIKDYLNYNLWPKNEL